MVTIIAAPSAADANSYLTEEEADALLDGFNVSIQEKWDDLESDERAQLLLEAARKIDQYGAWGPRRVAAQRLAFPRATDAAGAIPPEVKNAAAEYIAYQVEGDVVPLKRLQEEGVTSASILGQNTTFAADPSGLPAGARRELDRLRLTELPQIVHNRALDRSSDPESFFG